MSRTRTFHASKFAPTMKALWPAHFGHDTVAIDDPEHLKCGIHCRTCKVDERIAYADFYQHPIVEVAFCDHDGCETP
jgi:hypothetical protein